MLFQADMCSDPIDVYEYMHSQSVCSQLANFYESWAYILEGLGNVKKADEVYSLGIAKTAQPLERLQRQHRYHILSNETNFMWNNH
jgi:hypothetical protein